MSGKNGKRKLPTGIFSEEQRINLITKNMEAIARLIYDDETFACNFTMSNIVQTNGKPVSQKIIVVHAPKTMYTLEARSKG